MRIDTNVVGTYLTISYNRLEVSGINNIHVKLK